MKVIKSFIKSIFKIFENNKSVPENACPNCWGWQEYNGEVNLNKRQNEIKRGWIMEYFAKYIER